MGMKTKVVLIAALFMMSAVVISIPQTDLSANSGFTVTDGQGTEIAYDEPSNKIMTIGKGLTATVIELGHLDKIAVCDFYSISSEELFNGLKELVDQNKILANGNIYSSGKEALITDIVTAADTTKGGTFDKSKDTILMTGTQTYLASLVTELKGYGFERILVWNNVDAYDDVITYVNAVSMVVTGSSSDLVEQMKYLSKNISETLISNGISDSNRTKAFYVTYSNSAFKVGNAGSLATSMIIAAGGNAVTIDSTKANPTYEMSVTDLINTHGMDTVVFIDSQIKNSPPHLANLQGYLSSDVKVVPLESLWNNFSSESMDGVWTMACAMYPEYFSGDVPTVPSADDPDWVLYVAVAAVLIAVIAIAAFVYMRKS